MAARFLGQFLLERGIIDAEGLLRAVAHQEARNLKLGDLAVAEGILTREAAERINLEQRRTNAPFGEIAKQMGLLDASRIFELLARQLRSRVRIGEALVAVEAIAPEKLSTELAVFEREQEKEREEIDRAKPAMPWTFDPMYATAVSITRNLLMRIAGLRAREGAVLTKVDELDAVDVRVSVTFSGGWRGDYVLGFSHATGKYLATKMLGEPAVQPELVLDATKEFANVAAGQICASLGGEQIRCDLTAPQALGSSAIARYPGRRIALFCLDTPEGPVQLAIVEA